MSYTTLVYINNILKKINDDVNHGCKKHEGMDTCNKHSSIPDFDYIELATKISEIIDKSEDDRLKCGYTYCIRLYKRSPIKQKKLDLKASMERIDALIKAKGLKDKNIAKYLNVTPQAVNKWRHKSTFIDIENLYALSGLLGVRVDDLLVPSEINEGNVGKNEPYIDIDICDFLFSLFCLMSHSSTTG